MAKSKTEFRYYRTVKRKTGPAKSINTPEGEKAFKEWLSVTNEKRFREGIAEILSFAERFAKDMNLVTLFPTPIWVPAEEIAKAHKIPDGQWALAAKNTPQLQAVLSAVSDATCALQMAEAGNVWAAADHALAACKHYREAKALPWEEMGIKQRQPGITDVMVAKLNVVAKARKDYKAQRKRGESECMYASRMLQSNGIHEGFASPGSFRKWCSVNKEELQKRYIHRAEGGKVTP